MLLRLSFGVYEPYTSYTLSYYSLFLLFSYSPSFCCFSCLYFWLVLSLHFTHFSPYHLFLPVSSSFLYSASCPLLCLPSSPSPSPPPFSSRPLPCPSGRDRDPFAFINMEYYWVWDTMGRAYLISICVKRGILTILGKIYNFHKQERSKTKETHPSDVIFRRAPHAT